MQHVASARFAITIWDEKPYGESPGLPKLTRAAVVPGSGTGELRSLRGEGTSAVGHGAEHPLTLTYEWG